MLVPKAVGFGWCCPLAVSDVRVCCCGLTPPPSDWPAGQSKLSDLRIRIEIWLKEDDSSVVDSIATALRKEVPTWRGSFKRKSDHK